MTQPFRFTDLSLPRDADNRPSAVVFGYDPETDVFYPLAVEDMGDGTFRLKVGAEFSGSITIGDVEIKGSVSGVKADVSADKMLYVKSDDDPMNKKNITTIYTYVAAGNGTGKVETMKEYPTGAAGGSPAKLTTIGYDSEDRRISVAVSDTTV